MHALFDALREKHGFVALLLDYKVILHNFILIVGLLRIERSIDLIHKRIKEKQVMGRDIKAQRLNLMVHKVLYLNIVILIAY